jgi:hypothetical protein
MTIYEGDNVNNPPYAGGYGMSYPLYLHNLMQSEPVKDNSFGIWWVPNYNSRYFLDRLDSLHANLNRWLNNTYYQGRRYKDVIGYIDIRGVGNFGEWHHYPFMDNMSSPDGSPGSWPVGMRPTFNSLKRIVESHTKYFPDVQLVAMISAFDCERLNNTWNPPQIAAYLVDTAQNSAGKVGWRRDNWGTDDNYINYYLELNDRISIRGLPISHYFMNKYKEAPVIGEPNNGATFISGTDYGDLPRQIRFYHALS